MTPTETPLDKEGLKMTLIRRWFSKRQLTAREKEERGRRRFFTAFILINYSCLGVLGSCVLMVAWPFALFFGYFWERLPKAPYVPLWLPTLGLWLGGLPLWLLFTDITHPNWPVRLLIASITPLLFLAGAVTAKVVAATKRVRNTTNGGSNNAPPTNGQPPTRRHSWNRKPTWQRPNRHPLASVQF